MEEVASSSYALTRENDESKNEFTLYKRRYFLLATLFVLNLSNAMVSFFKYV